MSNNQNQQKQTMPPQHQDVQPGHEDMMNPQPKFDDTSYTGSGKLKNKVAIITGGDSGIGRAVAVFFAKEGANVVISYLNEQKDAEETQKHVEAQGQKCLLVAGDIGDESVCQQIVSKTIDAFGQLDIVVNNAAEQHPQKSIEDITSEQLERTFKTNIFSFFYLTKAALPHLKKGSAIVNTSSVTAYAGNEQLIDYSATKGAITTFTRSLALSLAGKGIRVNGVAPGPIWTPLIPSTFPADQVATFGSNVPMKRPGQPEELAPAYVFLASDDSSYMSGQMIHVNGGKIVNG
ncbi:SDR family oxidoreductase [Metabacillus endolithicus]|uniref:SDR family oxidoreductase n=1 Tax=Metabacillus endolithicus TaxID=1535204 RepID=A0ABW5C1K7_9BACI|nr:SDR family oxidoreductase [Metabacillus endolithicus]